MSISLKIIDSTSGFRELEDEWNILFEESSQANVFLSWDWMMTWWEVYQDQFKRELSILCIYQDEKLIGIAPFQILKSFPKYFIQGKTLCFIGSGESKQDRIISQYPDLIVARGSENQVINEVSKFLLQNRKLWDFADFEFLLQDSLISKCVDESTQSITVKLSQYGSRYFIDTFPDFEAYKANLGKRWRKMFEKKNRLLNRDGKLTIKTTENIDAIESYFNRLTEMHNERWQDKTKTSIFDSERFRTFHIKVMKRLLPKDKVFIKTLFLDDQALASYYCFTDKGQIHYYQSGFYSRYANKYSPLFILVCKEIGNAIKNNQKFDFMYTDESCSYKKDQYAASRIEMYRLKWTNQKFRFIIFDFAKYIQTKLLHINELKNKKIQKV